MFHSGVQVQGPQSTHSAQILSLCVWRGREVMVGGADPSGKVSWLPQRHPWCHCPGSSGGGSHEIRSLSDTLRWFGGRMCGKGKKSKEIKETVLPVPVPGPQLQDAPTRGRTNVWLPVWVSLPWSDMN